MSPSLAGRSAVVTGGGRGIGAAVARALAGAGANVALVARTAEEIERTAEDLAADRVKVAAIACDVTREDAVREMAARAKGRVGHVDILVNAAGDSASAPIAKVTLEEWNRMLAVNATGTFLCARAFTPGMVERGWGRIVNIASMVGLEGGRYVSHYSAAKHAVVGLTRSLALELSSTGVTVNALCPGYVDTAMTERTLGRVRSRTGLAPEEALAAVLATTGQTKLVKPEAVAERVLELCGERADHVSGQAIVIDGGELPGPSPESINPPSLGRPRGYSHGVLAPPGARVLAIAGQPGVALNADGLPEGAAPGFVAQFAHALDRVIAVVRVAGGRPESIVRLTVFVTGLAEYRAHLKELGDVWRERFGKYYPAMALVEVTGLVDEGACVEIEGTAVLGGKR